MQIKTHCQPDITDLSWAGQSHHSLPCLAWHRDGQSPLCRRRELAYPLSTPDTSQPVHTRGPANSVCPTIETQVYYCIDLQNMYMYCTDYSVICLCLQYWLTCNSSISSSSIYLWVFFFPRAPQSARQTLPVDRYVGRGKLIVAVRIGAGRQWTAGNADIWPAGCTAFAADLYRASIGNVAIWPAGCTTASTSIRDRWHSGIRSQLIRFTLALQLFTTAHAQKSA